VNYATTIFFTMNKALRRLLLALVSIFISANCLAGVQETTGATLPVQGVQARVLPNGIQIEGRDTILQVIALRDDVLRVRAGHNGRFPEDASWAVLPAARTASVQTVSEIADGRMGFHTASLRVACDADLRLTVSDLAGKVLQQDARPIEWQDHGFRIHKRKFVESHYFGLGDKPGPLDRAGQAFVMWNSDTFGWQESTDPIYKSVPYFIDYREGRALGVLFDNTWRTFFDFGREVSDQYSFGAPDGPVDYYLMYGPDPKHVVETYAWLTGPPPCRRSGHSATSNHGTATTPRRASSRLPIAFVPTISPPMQSISTSTTRITIVPSR
jgi:alpha-glucosidase